MALESLADIIPLIFLLVVWLLISIIWEKTGRNRGALRIYPLVIIYRSATLKKLIQRIGKKYSNFWRRLGVIADKVFMFVMGGGALYITLNAITLILGSYFEFVGVPIGSRFVVVIPFVTMPMNKILVFMLAGFVLAIILHELFHGVVSVAENRNIKSAGIIISLGIGGGFVEPDIEDELQAVIDSMETNTARDNIRKYCKASPHNLDTKTILRKFRRIVAAGMLANLILMLMFAGTLFGLGALKAYENYGLKIVQIDKNSPAQKYGLRVGDIIIMLAGQRVRTISDFQNTLSKLYPGANVSFLVLRNGTKIELFVVLAEKNGKAYIGVLIQQYIKSNIPIISDDAMFDMYYFLYINALLEFLVVIINVLPIFFLDGSQWLNSLLIEKYGRRGLRIGMTISIIITLIFILNFIAPSFASFLVQ